MAHAIVCTFDPDLENKVRKIWREFKEEGIGRTPGELEVRPHVTFSSHNDLNPDLLMDAIDNMAIKETSLKLSSFGAFTTNEDQLILYLSLSPTIKILSLHKQFHDYFDANGISYDSIYAPGKWIPHCTLALEMDRNQFSRGVEICCRYNSVLSGRFTRVSVIEYLPIKELMSRKLIF